MSSWVSFGSLWYSRQRSISSKLSKCMCIELFAIFLYYFKIAAGSVGIARLIPNIAICVFFLKKKIIFSHLKDLSILLIFLKNWFFYGFLCCFLGSVIPALHYFLYSACSWVWGRSFPFLVSWGGSLDYWFQIFPPFWIKNLVL